MAFPFTASSKSAFVTVRTNGRSYKVNRWNAMKVVFWMAFRRWRSASMTISLTGLSSCIARARRSCQRSSGIYLGCIARSFAAA